MIKVVTDRISKIGIKKTFLLIIDRIGFAWKYKKNIEFRKCYCCERETAFFQFGATNDGIRCIRCGANPRYELLSKYIRQDKIFSDKNYKVVEMDPLSPLKAILENRGCTYLRTFFSLKHERGSVVSGAQMQDICSMTFENESIDVIITSDVLEHVPDINLALIEIGRVLKKGGAHLFTVPMSEETKCRAFIENGRIVHFKDPEYHLDPLNEEGCLVYWNFGRDLVEFFSKYGFDTKSVMENVELNTVVWMATKN